ncbi:MAG TPA: hypothetical protein PL124_09080 [Candidatus Cloacimonadota bacterium]|nr:hypothetical protein [Candidatus Cloacimonadota bacterium]HPS39550.1 hypothetical protein [Candidatus Cloacimonadota bacterium]
MRVDPWIQERNAEVARKYQLLRESGAGYTEAIEILGREYHRSISTIKNLITGLSPKGVGR